MKINFTKDALLCTKFYIYLIASIYYFRRDRGFDYFFPPKNSSINYYSICYGSSVYSYIAPSLLHFIAYLYAIYLFRIKDNEQLHNLMERVSKYFILFSYCYSFRLIFTSIEYLCIKYFTVQNVSIMSSKTF